MKYHVCIIIPVYNVSMHIRRCACSLFEQTFEDIQYVFVNDCSPDDSEAILRDVMESYPERKKNISIVSHDKNKGLAAARSTGLEYVDADFILNIDSDDFVESDMVELMFNKAIEENADVVVCDFMLDWGKATKAASQEYSADHVEYTNMLLSGKVLPGVVNKLIRSDLYKEHDIKPVDGINMGEDYVTTPRLTYHARKIAKVDLPLYHYVQTNANSYTKLFSERSADNVIAAIKVLDDFFSDKEDSELFRRGLMEGKLRKKISLLMESSSDMRRSLAKLFPETRKMSFAVKLRFEERVSIYLADKGFFCMLNLFLFIYYNLLEYIQILKGRRR